MACRICTDRRVNQRTSANVGLTGKTLTIGSTGGGVATNITFGTGAGQIANLNDLNTALAANNLQASINTTGQITLTTTNNAASYNIGAIGGTATDPGGAFAGVSVVNTVADANSQAARASLVAQYNQTIDQIKTTAQDSSFNGVNLLNGDTLKLVFNETGKSTLNIVGVNSDPAGLGLSSLVQGVDFIDNSSTNKVLTALNNASSALRSQASAFDSAIFRSPPRTAHNDIIHHIRISTDVGINVAVNSEGYFCRRPISEFVEGALLWMTCCGSS